MDLVNWLNIGHRRGGSGEGVIREITKYGKRCIGVVNGPIHQHMPCFVAIEDLVVRTVLLRVHNLMCGT